MSDFINILVLDDQPDHCSKLIVKGLRGPKTKILSESYKNNVEIEWEEDPSNRLKINFVFPDLPSVGDALSFIENNKEDIRAKYHGALLDSNWKGELYDGTERLLEPLKKTAPDLYTAIFTGHVADERTSISSWVSLAIDLGASQFISKVDPAGLAEFVKKVMDRKKSIILEKRNIEKKRKSRNNQEQYSLEKVVEQDKLLFDLRSRLQPLYDYINGDNNSEIEDLRREIPSNIMLEGEPAAGKSTICEAVANYVRAHVVKFPRNAIPAGGTEGRTWETTLNTFFENVDGYTSKHDCVVVMCDDLDFGQVEKVSDVALRAQWQGFLSTLREYLLSTGENNNKLKKGKVLWLFTRNEAVDVGKLHPPFESVLEKHIVVFPRDKERRKNMVRAVTRDRYCKYIFDEDALDLVVEATMHYGGRDLLGQKGTTKGLPYNLVDYVKIREQDAVKHGNHVVNFTITRDIVDLYLNSSMHKSSMPNNNGIGFNASIENAHVSKHSKIELQNIGKNYKHLSTLEKFVFIEKCLGAPMDHKEIGGIIYPNGQDGGLHSQFNQHMWLKKMTNFVIKATPEAFLTKFPKIVEFYNNSQKIQELPDWIKIKANRP